MSQIGTRVYIYFIGDKFIDLTLKLPPKYVQAKWKRMMNNRRRSIVIEGTPITIMNKDQILYSQIEEVIIPDKPTE